MNNSFLITVESEPARFGGNVGKTTAEKDQSLVDCTFMCTAIPAKLYFVTDNPLIIEPPDEIAARRLPQVIMYTRLRCKLSLSSSDNNRKTSAQ